MQLVREDWKLFRNIETLSQKAGVHRQFIPLLVVKELVDNALDATGDCKLELIDHNSFRVTDEGTGIDPEWIHQYFSINRPMISSKLIRVPSRGALGNGLRVVTGAIVATNGQLEVSTRGGTYKVIPQDDGSSEVQYVGPSEYRGTSILVQLGMQVNQETLTWGKLAIQFSSNGTMYSGKSSPFWYTSESFFELVDSANMPLDMFVSLFCEKKKALSIVKQLEEGLYATFTTTCDLTFHNADYLLMLLREAITPPKTKSLGMVGNTLSGYEYHKNTSEFTVRSVRGKCDAIIPIVVESWVAIKNGGHTNDRSSISVCVNKTPVTADVRVSTKQATTTIWSSGLYAEIRSRPANFFLNIITPHMPITSDGKEPDFRPMARVIEDTLKRAASKARKKSQNESSGGRNEKEIVVENLSEAIFKTSGGGKYIFSQRQLYYAVRPYIMEAFMGKEFNYQYFCSILTDYENEYGDIPGMYRDPRGTLYHPHTNEEIPLGTIAVQNYKRPEWTFNKIIFIEKEGYFASLRDAGFPEKYDCALLSSKGYASRAVKDLFDLLGETDEEIQFFCVHDADAAGTKIFETLQESTNARPGRKVKVINLGLDPDEAVDMGLQIETFKAERRRPVAEYVSYEWADWLQSHRVELNAMTTPEFIEWLESKMELHGVGKIIPDDETLTRVFDETAEQAVRAQVLHTILKDNNYEELVAGELNKMHEVLESAKVHISSKVNRMLIENPTKRWDDPVKTLANNVIE